jgi:hypothetical protein
VWANALHWVIEDGKNSCLLRTCDQILRFGEH